MIRHGVSLLSGLIMAMDKWFHKRFRKWLCEILKSSICPQCKSTVASIVAQIKNSPDSMVVVLHLGTDRNVLSLLESKWKHILDLENVHAVGVQPGLKMALGLINGSRSPETEGADWRRVDLMIVQAMPVLPGDVLTYHALKWRIRPRHAVFHTDACTFTSRVLKCLPVFLLKGNTGYATAIISRLAYLLKYMCLDTYRRRMEQKTRILVFGFGGLGDIVCCVPSLRALRHSFPDAFIYFRTTGVGAELLELCPYVDEIDGTPERHAAVVRSSRMAAKLASYRFTLSINLNTNISLNEAIRPLAAGVKKRIGCESSILWEYGFCNPYSDYVLVDGKTGTRCAEYLKTVQLAGAKPSGEHLELWVDPEARQRVISVLGEADDRLLVVVHPGSQRYDRQWPASHYSRLIDQLQTMHPIRVLLTGNMEHEKGLIYGIAVGCQSSVEVAYHQFSTSEMLALVELSDLMISGDTGPMHMALSLKTPIVAIFGPSDPNHVVGNSRHDKCKIVRATCDYRDCRDCPVFDKSSRNRQSVLTKKARAYGNACTDAVTIAQVEDAIQSLIKGGTKPKYADRIRLHDK